MKGLIIYGVRAILEALESGEAIDKVWILKGNQSTLSLELVRNLTKKKNTNYFCPYTEIK